MNEQRAQDLVTCSSAYMAMANELNRSTDIYGPRVYEIRLKGQLGREWADWFGLTITLDETGVTRLTGPVRDQAALHGLLKKVRDLGIPLLSVNCVEHHSAPTQRDPGDHP